MAPESPAHHQCHPQQIAAALAAGKQTFVAGATVADYLPDNWQQAEDAGITAILTDYPLQRARVLRQGEDQRSQPK